MRRTDALLPGVLAVIGAVEAVAGGHEPLPLALGSFWLAAAVLCARRAAPLAVAPAVGIAYAVTPAVGFDVSNSAAWVLLLAFACLSTGMYAPLSRWPAGLGSVLASLGITSAGLAWFTDLDPNFLFGGIFSVGSWALGIAFRRALERNRELGAEAEQARIAVTRAAEQAVAAERERISAELHDALAHGLSGMVVQASVAGDQIGRDPEAATATLHAVAQDGRDALVETGRLLRLLRDDRDELGLQAAPIADVSLDRPAVPASQPSPARKIDRRDLLLPALFGVLSTAEIAWEGYDPLVASIAAYWLAAGVLCLRRVVPLAMPIAVAGILAGAGALGAETYAPGASILLAGLAMGSAGFHVPRSRAIAGAVCVSAGVALLALQASAEGDLSDVVLQVALVAPWAVGVGVRRALDRARELAADVERARIERELEAERGAAAERRRIARDLHDTLAKSLSVMIVQASLAADLVREDPRSAKSALAEVERSGRSTLAELAGLLRLAGAGSPGTEPQHGVADLPALADEYARAGLAVDLQIDDAVSRPPIGVDLSTYRIVQEALTNALKHAPGSPVRVTLGRQGSTYAIEVRNGRAAAATVAAATSGHGLIGVRERVSLFAGNLDAGPTPDGGFELVATLSVEGEAA